MTKNQLTLILVGVLFLSTLAAAYLTQKFNSSVKHSQEMAVDLTRLKNTAAVLQRLYAVSFEYGKTNPSIAPILQAATNVTVAQPAKAAAK